MPPGEELASLARSGATLAIHLSINNLAPVVRALLPHYGADCPAGDRPPRELARPAHPARYARRHPRAAKDAHITRTALILVGRALGAANFSESRLYAPDHHHVLRPRR